MPPTRVSLGPGTGSESFVGGGVEWDTGFKMGKELGLCVTGEDRAPGTLSCYI